MVKNMEVLLLRCNNCKHFFYSEIPNEKDISSMYKIHADRYNKKSKTKLIPQLKYKHKLQSIARTFPDAKTFDYGAGNCFGLKLHQNILRLQHLMNIFLE